MSVGSTQTWTMVVLLLLLWVSVDAGQMETAQDAAGRALTYVTLSYVPKPQTLVTIQCLNLCLPVFALTLSLISCTAIIIPATDLTLWLHLPRHATWPPDCKGAAGKLKWIETSEWKNSYTADCYNSTQYNASVFLEQWNDEYVVWRWNLQIASGVVMSFVMRYNIAVVNAVKCWEVVWWLQLECGINVLLLHTHCYCMQIAYTCTGWFEINHRQEKILNSSLW